MSIVTGPGIRAGGPRSAEGEGAHGTSVGGPEEGVLETGAGLDTAACGDAAAKRRPGSDDRAAPDGGRFDARALADRGVGDGAPAGVEARYRTGGKNPGVLVEPSGAGRERPTARERFERRAEEIARSAEIGERPLVEEPADFLPPFGEEGLPEIRDERGFARGNAREQAGSERADAGVEQRRAVERPRPSSAESRDSVPFGLKRRVPVGLDVFDDEEGGGAPALPMAPQEAAVVRLDGGVGVHDQEIAAGEPRGGVAERAGSAEDFGLGEEAELREFRRAVDQVLLDLFAEMVEVDRGRNDSGIAQPSEVRARQGNVQVLEERFRNRLGDRAEPDAAPGGEKERPRDRGRWFDGQVSPDMPFRG